MGIISFCNMFISESVTLILTFLTFCWFCTCNDYCVKDQECGNHWKSTPRYFLYDVNYPEGFNLRRDVYMRLAIFMHNLKSSGQDWHLVLPPWHHLYHWKSTDIGDQTQLPWSTFFDIESMQRFSPVIEFQDFLTEVKNSTLEQIYYLQHFTDAFASSNWDWSDQWNFSDCDNHTICKGNNCAGSSYIYDGKLHHGWFWGFKEIKSLSLRCVSFQGPASMLKELLDSDLSSSSVMVDHAEVVIHDTFGDSLYWKCRRSMRFSKALFKEADTFRYNFLDSNDTKDVTVRPKKWENEKAQRKALGGPYVCAHLRRGDFLFGRSQQVPSIEYAAGQVKDILKSEKLNTVFISTDTTPEDVNLFKKHLKSFKVVQYKPDFETRKKLKDGGIAIVDQIICTYARFFIGTHESTFTFRIQEEREIVGFKVDSTFNLFCAAPQNCFESSRWTIVF